MSWTSGQDVSSPGISALDTRSPSYNEVKIELFNTDACEVKCLEKLETVASLLKCHC